MVRFQRDLRRLFEQGLKLSFPGVDRACLRSIGELGPIFNLGRCEPNYGNCLVSDPATPRRLREQLVPLDRFGLNLLRCFAKERSHRWEASSSDSIWAEEKPGRPCFAVSSGSAVSFWASSARFILHEPYPRRAGLQCFRSSLRQRRLQMLLQSSPCAEEFVAPPPSLGWVGNGIRGR